MPQTEANVLVPYLLLPYVNVKGPRRLILLTVTFSRGDVLNTTVWALTRGFVIKC